MDIEITRAITVVRMLDGMNRESNAGPVKEADSSLEV